MREIGESVARRLAAEGARAVVLTGSVARGTAKPDSDVDLFALGDGPREQHEVVDGRLVGIHWFTPEEVHARLGDPEHALMTARAWRDGVILHDPDGLAAELKRAAKDWSWDDIHARADVWARDELVGWAEYLPKLRRAVEDGRGLDASALAAQTALKIAEILAVARRVDVESENGFWESVAASVEPQWRDAFAGALAGAATNERAEAATRLFRLMADELDGALEGDHAAVVARALGRSD